MRLGSIALPYPQNWSQ